MHSQSCQTSQRRDYSKENKFCNFTHPTTFFMVSIKIKYCIQYKKEVDQKKFVGGLSKELGGWGTSSLLGGTDTTGVAQAGGDPAAAYRERTDQRGPDSCLRCLSLRDESQWTQAETQATPGRFVGKLFMEALSLELIQHLTGQHLEQSALLGIPLSRVLDSWTSPPEIFSNPSYSMNLKILLNLYQQRTIS